MKSLLKKLSQIDFFFSCYKTDYIGGTKQHLSTRIKEHLETNRNSHLDKHLNESPRYKSLSNNDCFSIKDYTTTHIGIRNL